MERNHYAELMADADNPYAKLLTIGELDHIRRFACSRWVHNGGMLRDLILHIDALTAELKRLRGGDSTEHADPALVEP